MSNYEEIRQQLAIEEELAINGVVLPEENLFIQVPLNFVRSEKMSAVEKAIYMYIWSCGITHKVGFPSQKKMARAVGVSVPTLIKSIKSLEQKNGLVSIERRYEGTKEKTTSIYYLGKMTTDGAFCEKHLNPVKTLYPDRIKYIPKPIYK